MDQDFQRNMFNSQQKLCQPSNSKSLNGVGEMVKGAARFSSPNADDSGFGEFVLHGECHGEIRHEKRRSHLEDVPSETVFWESALVGSSTPQRSNPLYIETPKANLEQTNKSLDSDAEILEIDLRRRRTGFTLHRELFECVNSAQSCSTQPQWLIGSHKIQPPPYNIVDCRFKQYLKEAPTNSQNVLNATTCIETYHAPPTYKVPDKSDWYDEKRVDLLHHTMGDPHRDSVDIYRNVDKSLTDCPKPNSNNTGPHGALQDIGAHDTDTYCKGSESALLKDTDQTRIGHSTDVFVVDSNNNVTCSPEQSYRRVLQSNKTHTQRTNVDIKESVHPHFKDSEKKTSVYVPYACLKKTNETDGTCEDDKSTDNTVANIDHIKTVFKPAFSDVSDEEYVDHHEDTNIAVPSDLTDTDSTNEIGSPPYQSLSDGPPKVESIGIFKNKKQLKRKMTTPRKSASKMDPRFRGVTMWLQTEFKSGQSNLQISAFYSNVKTGSPPSSYNHHAYHHVNTSPEQYSFSDAEGCYQHHGIKMCASCRTRRTPLWRDAEDGTPLCNACGIRYKKYRLRCSKCWHIPKKEIKTYPNCPICGSSLRYSFHNRKTW